MTRHTCPKALPVTAAVNRPGFTLAEFILTQFIASLLLIVAHNTLSVQLSFNTETQNQRLRSFAANRFLEGVAYQIPPGHVETSNASAFSIVMYNLEEPVSTNDIRLLCYIYDTQARAIKLYVENQHYPTRSCENGQIIMEDVTEFSFTGEHGCFTLELRLEGDNLTRRRVICESDPENT